MSGIKHVYILGAGFSAPLGGPLFGELFSCSDDVAYRCGSLNDAKSILLQQFPHVYEQLKRRFPHWNAEQWIEAIASIDVSPLSQLSAGILRILDEMKIPYEDATDGAKILTDIVCARLALETTNFLHRIRKDSERWIPFDNWFKLLSSNDTIITFNYDDVVERVANRTGRPFPTRNGVSLPYRSDGPRLIKLHGSADVFIDDNATSGPRIYTQCHNEVEKYAQCLHEHRVLIGTPGNKNSLANSLLRDEWNSAAIAIREAHVVSIIGYSMPETDNYAREFILDNLATDIERKLAVDVVLGSDSEGKIATRVRTMLNHVFGRSASFRAIPRIVSAFAQDYISHYRYDKLVNLGPYRWNGEVASRFTDGDDPVTWSKKYGITDWL